MAKGRRLGALCRDGGFSNSLMHTLGKETAGLSHISSRTGDTFQHAALRGGECWTLPLALGEQWLMTTSGHEDGDPIPGKSTPSALSGVRPSAGRGDPPEPLCSKLATVPEVPPCGLHPPLKPCGPQLAISCCHIER